MTQLLKKSKILNTLLCLTILATPITVHAGDTEELLNVYNMTLGSPTKTQTESEINSIEKEIEVAVSTKEYVDNYNRTVDMQSKRDSEEKAKLLNDVQTLMSSNESILSNINSSLSTMDIETLLSSDKKYKSNVAVMNDLLHRADEYDKVYNYLSYDLDVSSLKLELEEKIVVYADALDTFNLGKVKGIEFPLGVERYTASSYGSRVDPIDSTAIRFHAGTDYSCPTGTEVKSLFNGTVSAAGYSATIGYYVVILHGDNVKTLYCSLSEVKVNEGDSVSQYDVIGLSGSSGKRCTGEHVHIAMYINGATVDVDRLFKQ